LAREKLNEFIIGCAINWWGGHPDLDRIAVNTHALCGGSFRLEVNGKDRSVFGVLHNQRVHP